MRSVLWRSAASIGPGRCRIGRGPQASAPSDFAAAFLAVALPALSAAGALERVAATVILPPAFLHGFDRRLGRTGHRNTFSLACQLAFCKKPHAVARFL